MTAIDVAPAAPDARADFYDTAGRLRLKNATDAEAARSLPQGIYVVQGRRVAIR